MAPFFKQGAFAIDPNATPDQIAQKRAYIAAMMPRFGSAKYVGEGLGQLASGVVIGRHNKKLNEAEGAGRKSAEEMFGRLFGTANSAQSQDVQGPMSVLGMTPSQPAPVDPSSPTALGDDAMTALGKPPVRDYRESLIGTESGGNWAAQNSETGAGGKKGHFGRVQFGQARLQEAMDAGVIPQGITPEQFMASPDLQMAAEDWHFADLEKKLSPYVGAVVNGQPMDIGALVAMGHLGGAEGAKRFVESGGKYNPSDSFGTSLADYAQKHGGTASPFTGGAAPAPASAPTIPINELYMALQNPWLSAEEKGLITSMIGEQQQASDPLRQLELRKAEIELAQLENPTQQPPEDFATRMFTLNALKIDPQSEKGKVYLMTGKMPDASGGDVPAAFASLDMQAQAAGLVPGTPEYQTFMRSGGGAGAPAAFVALDLQAKAAGFEPGTQEYQEFMATRGAGLAAEATTRGKAAAEAEIAAPADIASAETTLGYITSLRDHPGRQAGSGASSLLGSIPGTSAKEFQIEVERLKAGAFLTAIDQLKGMGALSNAEGQTATAAVAALDPGGTEEGFLKRLAEYEEIVNRGLERARKRAAPEAPAKGNKTTIDGYTIEAIE